MMRQQNLWRDLTQQAILISTSIAAVYQFKLSADFASQKIHTPPFTLESRRTCRYAIV